MVLYPSDANGHPVDYGYNLIADELASKIKLSWQEPEGLVALFSSETNYQLGLVRDGYYYTFSHTDIIEANGWDPDITPISIRPRDIANFPNLGMITYVDKEKFGPK